MSVDELCRSYLDLKYHFDPAAASAAGLVSHDGRLGSFFSHAHGPAMRKLPRRLWARLRLSAGDSIAPEQASLGGLQQAVAGLHGAGRP